MRTNTRHTPGVTDVGRPVVIAVLLIVALAAGTPLHAQDDAKAVDTARAQIDPRWHPWLGCWDVLRDTVHEPDLTRPGEPFPRGALGRTASGESRVCVSPAHDGSGARLRTEVQGQPVLDETIVADGTDRSVDDGQACRGWRRDEWSGDGRRLFGRAELTCAGEPPQAVSHLGLITAGGAYWLDIQGITSGGRQAVRVRRYRRAGGEAAREGVQPAGPAHAIDVEGVKEASRKVDSLVLEAALVETQARFALNGRTMLALQDAGVPGDVTDVMVALSYPSRFRVSRVRPSGGVAGPDEWSGYDWTYAPFGFSAWSFGGWWGPPTTIIEGASGGDGGGGSPAEGHGRVVNNRGYTRIESVGPARARSAPGTSSSASAGDSGSSGSSGSSSGGVSSQGYSGGGSGGGDRTAQPR